MDLFNIDYTVELPEGRGVDRVNAASDVRSVRSWQRTGREDYIESY